MNVDGKHHAVLLLEQEQTDRITQQWWSNELNSTQKKQNLKISSEILTNVQKSELRNRYTVQNTIHEHNRIERVIKQLNDTQRHLAEQNESISIRQRINTDYNALFEQESQHRAMLRLFQPLQIVRHVSVYRMEDEQQDALISISHSQQNTTRCQNDDYRQQSRRKAMNTLHAQAEIHAHNR
eukprot:804641_1